MNRLGLVFDSRYLHHTIAIPSLENPERLRSLYLQLQQEKYTKSTFHIPPRNATSAEIHMVHSSFYVEQLREHAVKSDPFS